MSNMPTFENPCGAYSRYEITKSIPLDRLQEICQAQKDGRLLVLPCKVGQSVWFIENTLNVYNGKTTREIVERVVSEVRGNKHNPVWYLAEGRDFHPSTIGKRVFLTHTEAEAAIRESKPCP